MICFAEYLFLNIRIKDLFATFSHIPKYFRSDSSIIRWLKSYKDAGSNKKNPKATNLVTETYRQTDIAYCGGVPSWRKIKWSSSCYWLFSLMSVKKIDFKNIVGVPDNTCFFYLFHDNEFLSRIRRGKKDNQISNNAVL